MKKVKITVLKKAKYDDLIALYENNIERTKALLRGEEGVRFELNV